MSKVRFGLKNVHYAVLTESADNSNNVWATPVAVPGAVSLTLDSNEADNTFYADNISYYKSLANNGYTGSLEMAKIPDSMLKDVWGMDVTGGIVTESSGVQPNPFALLFQFESDKDPEVHVLYRVIPTSKPTEGSSTIEEAPTPVTQTFEFQALPIVTGPAYQKNKIRAKSASTAVAATWFNAVNIATTA